MENSSLVFIIGAPRSGTTWVWGLLTSHPDVVPLVREDFEPQNPSVVDGKRITSETGIFLKKEKWEISEIIKKKIIDNRQKIIVEKTPLHIFHINDILEIFPKSKIIYIQRDPRAVISSMLYSNFFQFAENLEDAIGKYRSYYEAAKPFFERKNMLIIKYEDLSFAPRKALQKILSFLDIPLDDSNTQKILQENSGKTKVSIEGVFRKGKIDSYKEDLSKDGIKKIEIKLKDIMERFGYQ